MIWRTLFLHFFSITLAVNLLVPISLKGQDCHKYLLDVYDTGDITSLTDTTCLRHLTDNMGNAYFLFKSAIHSSNPTYTRYLLLQFPVFGFTRDEITDMLDDTSKSFIANLTQSDPTIEESYDVKLMYHLNNFEMSKEVELIREMHAVDQFSRYDYRKFLSQESWSELVHLVDSINFMILLEKFQSNPDLLVDKALGHEALKQLYIILLHGCRRISEEKFVKLNAILLKLVHEKKFSPYYYANIYDERLRIQESPSYPYYNTLRNESLEPDQAKVVEMNRKTIGAITLSSNN